MIRVYKDGDQWCALFGVNLQDGECEFADTPDEAAQKLLTRLHKEMPDKFTSPIAKECINWSFYAGHGRNYNYIGKMPKGEWL
jgi:hypothetical protein